MGGLTEFRNHLYNLFSSLFKRHLAPEERHFCLLILDVMQFLAGRVHYMGEANDEQRQFNARGVAHSIKEVVQDYMDSQAEYEYQVHKGVVVLLDTAKDVPTNKARTQKKRGATEGSAILDEERFNSALGDGTRDWRHIGQPLEWQLEGEVIWRSNNLKFHLSCLITEALLELKPRRGLKLIIDDGVAVTDQIYMKERERMIEDYEFEDRSFYEQECLVANLARHHFTERFVLTSESREVLRLPSPAVGEADIKIPRFLVHGNNTRRYLVVSQDTDIIFILLLHMKTLESESREPIDVWLDTQRPDDKRRGLSRSYRFIHISGLYRAILTLFAREYPTIKNPVETLVFLAYALETDFTAGFNECAKVNARLVWNTFSALHTNPMLLKEEGYILFNNFMHDELVKGTVSSKESAKQGVRRSTERQCLWPSQWHNLLDEVVQSVYNVESDMYELTLDDTKATPFFYALCQQRVIDDLALLGHPEFDKKRGIKRSFILTVDELFVWTAEIEAKVEAHRKQSATTQQEEESRKRKLFTQLSLSNESKKQAKTIAIPRPSLSSRPSSSCSEVFSLLDDIEEIVEVDVKPIQLFPLLDDIEEIIEVEVDVEPVQFQPLVQSPAARVTANNKKIVTLAKNQLPKDYGIPRLQGMIARVYRIEWLMNYHQNGWKSSSYALNFSEASEQDASLSKYGWRAKEVPQCELSVKRGDFNNSYYSLVYTKGVQPGMMPFKVYEMVETDEIYNRNYLFYQDVSSK
jgi:hypothetical protein